MFRPFNERDWLTFSGCVSDSPQIHEEGRITIVMDGNGFNVFWLDTDFEMFSWIQKMETGPEDRVFSGYLMEICRMYENDPERLDMVLMSRGFDRVE